MTLIVAAVVLDGLDGRSARMLNLTSKLGAELDSLADFLSFGVAPAVLTYLWTLHDVRGIGWAVAMLFATCCALAPRPLQHRARGSRPPALDPLFLHRHPGTGRGRPGTDADDHVVRVRRRVAAQLAAERGHAGVRGRHDGQPRADLLDQAHPRQTGAWCCRRSWSPSVIIVGLVVETWLTLSVIGIVYLCSIPFGVLSARRMKRRETTAVDTATAEPEAEAAAPERVVTLGPRQQRPRVRLTPPESAAFCDR